MSYNIAGRAIKNEYLAIGTILSTIGIALAASSGDKAAPAAESKEIKVNAGSSEEEEFIRNFVAEAEKSESSTKH